MHFLPAWEERFTVAPRNPRNAHRRLDRGQRLEEILSVRVARKVADDHTVSWDGTRWGVPREEVCAGLRFRGRYLRLRHCPAAAPRAVSPSGLRPPGLTANPLSKVYKSAPPTTMADISIRQKTGHFYFALTDAVLVASEQPSCGTLVRVHFPDSPALSRPSLSLDCASIASVAPAVGCRYIFRTFALCATFSLPNLTASIEDKNR